MEASPRRQQATGSYSRSGQNVLSQLEAIVIGFMILGLSFSTAIAMPWTGTSRGIQSLRAELLHCDHPLSPLRSPENLSQAGKFRSEVDTSTTRSQNLSRRRQLGVSESTFESTAIEGTETEYLMIFSVGTPARKFMALADTGSDLVWVQCAPCLDCFDQSVPVFFPNMSSTYSKQSCESAGCEAFLSQYGSTNLDSKVCKSSSNPSQTGCPPYNYTYGAGFTEGTFSADSVTLTSTDGSDVVVPDFWFGCSNVSDSPNSIFNSSQGLVGLGRGVISFPSQLANRNLTEDKFAYCLVNRSLAMVRSSLIVFGNDNVLSVTVAKELQYTPLLSIDIYFTFYYVSLEAILVNGVALDFSPSDAAINETDGSGGTILDSGTRYTLLLEFLFELLVTAVNNTVLLPEVSPDSLMSTQIPGYLPVLCYDFTGISPVDYASQVPSISFKFANASTWDMHFEHSWILLQNDTVACLAFNGGGYPGNIIGNIQMRDFYVQFDRVNQRIGFAPTDCGAFAL